MSSSLFSTAVDRGTDPAPSAWRSGGLQINAAFGVRGEAAVVGATNSPNARPAVPCRSGKTCRKPRRTTVTGRVYFYPYGRIMDVRRGWETSRPDGERWMLPDVRQLAAMSPGEDQRSGRLVFARTPRLVSPGETSLCHRHCSRLPSTRP